MPEVFISNFAYNGISKMQYRDYQTNYLNYDIKIRK